ncbi:ComEA family DNA-binding protein [Pseudoalteromonas sp. T1lg65]|uniref:ComEA family DNA-binding protein n=1 Tax=Pseudoalteromonas sp. T1lg65 TaxID=2077101 RepID=UPI003F799F5B
MFFKSSLLIATLAVSSFGLNAQVLEVQEAFSEAKSQSITQLNINTADESALSSLPGIGKRKAKAIVDYREQHGSFQSPEELLNVKGIGKGIFAKIEGKIKI